MHTAVEATFRDALEEHLQALIARDIDRFAQTISRSDETATTGAAGVTARGFDQIVANHAQWFAAPNRWAFEYRILWGRESDDMAVTLLDCSYVDSPNTPPSRFLLSMVFVREEGSWRFLFDQNTPLTTAGERRV